MTCQEDSYFPPAILSGDAVRIQATSTHLGNTYNVGGDLTFNNNTEVKDKGSSDSRRIHLTNWLSGLTPVNQYAIQKETRERLAPGTAKWILGHPKFGQWLRSNSSTFWGVGIPGAGKTCLTSYIVHHLQEQWQSNDTEGQKHLVIFAYCRFNDKLSVLQILCSLLQQLVEFSEPVEDYVYQRLYGPNLQRKTTPTKSELVAIFQGISHLLPRTFIIVDALDEILDDVRDELINLLLSLKKNLFVKSREIDLSPIAKPTLRIRALEEDLEAFFMHEIQRRPRLRSLLSNRREVIHELVQHIQIASDGMFLLATLYLSALSNVTSVAGIRKAIKCLPVSVGAMYEMTQQRINSQSDEERKLANQAIMWVTHARRQLTIQELVTALSIEPDSTVLDPDACTDGRTLISICCGLLELTAGSSLSFPGLRPEDSATSIPHTTGLNAASSFLRAQPSVRLIHYTAHDFFVSQHNTLHSNPHTLSATICAVYLDLSGVLKHGPGSVPLVTKIREIYQCYPFAPYAILNLGNHTSLAAQELQGEVPSRVHRFLTDLPLIPLARELTLPSPSLTVFEPPDSHILSVNLPETMNPICSDCGTIVHFAALHGLMSILLPLSASTDVTVEGYDALFYACVGRHFGAVKAILDASRTSKAFKRDRKVISLAPKANALHIASRDGSEDIVDALIKSSTIPIDSVDKNMNTALHLSCNNGHVKVVRLLLDAGVNDGARGSAGHTAFHIACIAGHKEIVEILITRPRCEVNLPVLPEKGSFTPLHLASMMGHSSVVECLLGHSDIDVNAIGHAEMTALHIAVTYRHLPVVELLAKASMIKLNAQDHLGSSPLHIAAMHGYTEVVSFLLTVPGIELNMKDKLGSTALDQAWLNGHKDVSCLMEAQSDAGAKERLGPLGRGPKDAWRWLLGSSLEPIETPGWRSSYNSTLTSSFVHADQ